MSIVYEQREEKEIRKPIKELLWKSDGKVVSVEGKEKIIELISRGFKQLTVKEKERFKEGSYNPVYDLRMKEMAGFGIQNYSVDSNKKDVKYFEVIKI